MKKAGTLQVTTPTEREIVMTREFDAPRRLVFDAYTRPELLKRWMFGPDGWVLAVCEVDLRARDAALESGMEDGMAGGFDRLEGVLAGMAR